MGSRHATWIAALALANLPASAQAPCPGIHVKVLNIRNSTATVACALFESAAGFPAEFLRSATNLMVIKIRDTHARCDFEDIPAGTYALAVIHDENMNGEIPTGWESRRKATAFPGTPRADSARLRSRLPLSRTTA